MHRSQTTELEFDKIQALVAAQARTGLGRRLLTEGVDGLPPFEEGTRRARLTRAMERLLDEGDRLPLSGIDEALPWLEPGAAAPTEPRELLSLLALARRIAAVRRRLEGAPIELKELADSLPDTSDLVAEVAPRLGRDGSIPDEASPQLARLRRQLISLRGELSSRLEGIRRAHPDAATDAPPTVRRDRYCLPVRAGARSRLPGLLLDTSSRGATAFIEPFEVVELNNELAAATAQEAEEVRRIVAEIAAAFAEIRDQLLGAVETLALLDAAQARVLFGRRVNGKVVVPGGGEELILCGARHPLLDEGLQPLRAELFGDAERRDPEHRVVPLDFRTPEKARTLVVSGPNAGGKTVVLKTIGLMVLMAYHGIPLPAEEGTVIPRLDTLWCHVGDEQNVAADLSTFSGAMAASVALLESSGEHSLVLYDELGAGTDPLEGAALGCALLEELTRRSCLTVATTHLAAIALAASTTDGMENAAMGYDETEERPTYRLVIGRPGRSRALEIARRTGIPKRLLGRAEELLGGQHLELDRWLRRLEELEANLLEERGELQARQRGLERLEAEAESELERLRSELAEMPLRLADERDQLRRRAKQRLDQALERLDEAVASAERLGKRRRQKLREEALDLGPPEQSRASAEALEKGSRVRLASLGGVGVLEELRGSLARVRVGGKRLWVAADALAAETSAADRSPPRVEVTSDEPESSELVLLGMDSEQARDELERFLDRAFTSGRGMVRVVHGHGTGVLRRMVSELCRSHPAVRSFRHPPRQRGGTGATEITLEPSD